MSDSDNATQLAWWKEYRTALQAAAMANIDLNGYSRPGFSASHVSREQIPAMIRKCDEMIALYEPGGGFWLAQMADL